MVLEHVDIAEAYIFPALFLKGTLKNAPKLARPIENIFPIVRVIIGLFLPVYTHHMATNI